MSVSDIKCKLSSFAHWSANHARREANEMAHVLVRDALKIPDVIVDMEAGPHCIQFLLRMNWLIKKSCLIKKKTKINLVDNT